MRVLMTVEFETEKANHAIEDNTLPQIMKSAFEEIKPEAVYFGAKDGKRTGFIVFDLVDSTDIPSFAEPFFQSLNAKIDLTPVMDFADIQTGLQKYASH